MLARCCLDMQTLDGLAGGKPSMPLLLLLQVVDGHSLLKRRAPGTPAAAAYLRTAAEARFTSPGVSWSKGWSVQGGKQGAHHPVSTAGKTQP